MSTETTVKGSLGVAMKRKEDPRFIQGGHYVDDLSFRACCTWSSCEPHPHAEIVNIDISEALNVPGEGRDHRQDLEAAGLGWLPTFHGLDKQMVLAIGKVLFRYSGSGGRLRRDARRRRRWRGTGAGELQPLPVVADPFTAKKDEVLLRPTASRRPTTSTTGRSATRTAPSRRWRRARSGSPSGCGFRAATRRRSSRAAAWRNSTPWAA